MQELVNRAKELLADGTVVRVLAQLGQLMRLHSMRDFRPR